MNIQITVGLCNNGTIIYTLITMVLSLTFREFKIASSAAAVLYSNYSSIVFQTEKFNLFD